LTFNHIYIFIDEKELFRLNRRVLLTGTTSIHGWPVFQKFRSKYPQEQIFAIRPPKMRIPQGNNVIAECITQIDSFRKIKHEFNPTHIIHCAGVCDLDVCEERPHWAYNINVNGAKTIREVFGEDCHIIYLSADLVFSGEEYPQKGYREEHYPDPVSVAGKTIFQAEEEIKKSLYWCILRLGLPLGDSITGTKGAIDWIEGRFKKNRPVTLFHDEIRSCIECRELANYVFFAHQEELQGLFHLGGNKVMSLYQIGKKVLAKKNYPKNLLNTISRKEEKNGPPRIGNVTLDSTKLETIMKLCNPI